LRLLDWGVASISHPFMSLVVTFRFLEETNKLAPNDSWFARLRDAYLEPWGRGLEDAFTLRLRSRSESARSRTPSLGRANAMHCRRPTGRSSTGGSWSFCGVRWLEHSSEVVTGDLGVGAGPDL
jgi:hypothetical protein